MPESAYYYLLSALYLADVRRDRLQVWVFFFFFSRVISLTLRYLDTVVCSVK